MHVADENDIDLAQPRIGRTGYRATGVVEDARAVRILKEQRAVLRAELAVLTASNKRAFPQSRRTVRSGGSDLAAHSDTASRSQPQDARDKPVFDAHSIT